MNKRLQDLTWSVLPKEFKGEVKKMYATPYKYFGSNYNGACAAFNMLFGHHNLTSDAEGEEMLICEKSKIQTIYKDVDECLQNAIKELGVYNMYTMQFRGILSSIKELFGYKYLPDELNEEMKSIESKVSVYLATEEEDEELRLLLYKNGFKWQSGRSLISATYWSSSPEELKVYNMYPDRSVTYGGNIPDSLTFTEFKRQYFNNPVFKGLSLHKKYERVELIQAEILKEEEPNCPDFKNITTFGDACTALGISLSCKGPIENIVRSIRDGLRSPRATVAALKLNIIRKALNLGHEMSFKEGVIWYPHVTAALHSNSCCKSSNRWREVAKVKIGNDVFSLLGGSAFNGTYAGLGTFNSLKGVALSFADVGFLGCATKEIAEHMSLYFSKVIFDAKYGDLIDYKWI